MKIYQYFITGKKYDKDCNIEKTIKEYFSNYDVSILTKINGENIFIQTKGEEETLLKIEPRLLRKLSSIIYVSLYSKKEPIPNNNIDNQKKETENKIDFRYIAKLLRQEKIIAIQNEHNYTLVCSASKVKSIQLLRDITNEPTKPITVMFNSITDMKNLVNLSKKEIEFLENHKNGIISSKIRNLHRLEKTRYKYKLTPKINPINRRVQVCLPSSKHYEDIFKIIKFPLAIYEATDKKGNLICNKEKLLKEYQEISYVIDNNKDIDKCIKQNIYQITYSKLQQIYPVKKVEADDKYFDIILDSRESKIGSYTLKNIKLTQKDDLKHIALSFLFSNLKFDNIKALKLPFTISELENYYQEWQKSSFSSNSLIYLFDTIAYLSKESETKSFLLENILTCENVYEVCEEDLLEYEIKNNIIDIDLFLAYKQNPKLKYLASSLVNTLSTIIKNLALKEKATNVRLSGDIFYFRDFTELTIEKLQDNQINVELI